MGLEQEFKETATLIQNLPTDGPYKPSQEERLAVYSLFKQSTVGKCNTAKPGITELQAKAKWDAWNKLGDLSKDEAMKKYIEEYKKLDKKFKGQ